MITSAQIRAGRALINAKQSELAKAAGVSLATLNNIERGLGDPRASTLEAIQRALESAGVTMESDGVHETVSLSTLLRPTTYDTYAASQRVLELLTQDKLFKLDRLLFFVRWAHNVHEGDEPHRICLLAEGKSRSILFDQVDFNLSGGARVAEVAGIMLVAFAKYGADLEYIPDILDDTTINPADEVAARLRNADRMVLSHPKDLVDLIGNWEGLVAHFGDRQGHPMQNLVQFLKVTGRTG
ncbi:helix-turn-helix transcriptional regulator [Aestuariispira insulae]|uniref:Helix-turn-helix protein n=1 Tax=Aestuariispira insulae TaxID=1461337 RepID=A0A3D9HV58_9PROT|nr:helix-turn-helix transcriptional regulator [Aestuariispira insulae]RED53261.1 helix-turn-helix protein [Aestuariispira insulae]